MFTNLLTTPLEPTHLLALLVVVVAMPVNWFVTYRLWRLYRANRGVRALRDRALVAAFLSGLVTAFAIVFVNNELPIPPLDAFATKIITRGAVLALSIPALLWLRQYRRWRR